MWTAVLTVLVARILRIRGELNQPHIQSLESDQTFSSF